MLSLCLLWRGSYVGRMVQQVCVSLGLPVGREQRRQEDAHPTRACFMPRVEDPSRVPQLLRSSLLTLLDPVIVSLSRALANDKHAKQLRHDPQPTINHHHQHHRHRHLLPTTTIAVSLPSRYYNPPLLGQLLDRFAPSPNPAIAALQTRLILTSADTLGLRHPVLEQLYGSCLQQGQALDVGHVP